MELTTTEYKRCTVVKPVGRIDSYTAPTLEETLLSLTNNENYKLVLDMEEVDFMSAKGWFVLIEIQKACKRYGRGELVMSGMQERIRDSLEVVGIGSYFQQFDDLVSAVAHY